MLVRIYFLFFYFLLHQFAAGLAYSSIGPFITIFFIFSFLFSIFQKMLTLISFCSKFSKMFAFSLFILKKQIFAFKKMYRYVKNKFVSFKIAQNVITQTYFKKCEQNFEHEFFRKSQQNLNLTQK